MDDASLSLTGRTWSTSSAVAMNQDWSNQLLKIRELSVKTSGDIQLADPDIFPDMCIAVDVITEAIASNKNIGIFGDYDCDGVTSTAQLVRYFRAKSVEPWVRLPHRVRDGYGLNMNVVQEIIDANIDVLITVDTGVSCVKEIQVLIDNDIEVIITDHHQPGELLPNATAIIHPEICNYPQPHPSGAGVVFQLLRALHGGIIWEDFATDVALAALGTTADLVPLKGDNRQLVQLGVRALRSLQTGPLAEFMALVQGENSSLNSTDIAFKMAPRINAAGRIGDPTIALKAVLEGGDDLKKLDRLNTERQRMTIKQVEDALTSISEDDNFIVVQSADYHPGIVGLIAGKLCEQFGKPALVAHSKEGKSVASLRSIAGYDVTGALRRNKELLTTFGGHAQAAGCGFASDNFNELKQALQKDVASHASTATFIPTLNVDIVMSGEKLTLTTLQQLEPLEPFGMGNPEPLWLIKGANISGLRAVGTDNKHLQLTINNTKAIGFGLGHFAEQLNSQHDVLVKLGKNVWQGQTSLQFIVEDIR